MTGALTLGGVPTLASLIGTSGEAPLLRSINMDMNNNDFFGGVNDLMARSRDAFVTNIVRPIQMIGNSIKNMTNFFDYDEKYIPITSEDLLTKIPVCMQDSILRYEPVRKLFDSGRIFGFGHTAIVDGDPYGRLISNGFVEDVFEAMDDKCEFEFKYEWHSTDPDLSEEEIESIDETRRYLDWVLRNTDIDFTDPVPGNSRG